MKTKEDVAKYNRIRTNAINRLRQEYYEIYRTIYIEEALKVGVRPPNLPIVNGKRAGYKKITTNPL
jgi:hypothetical protein